MNSAGNVYAHGQVLWGYSTQTSRRMTWFQRRQHQQCRAVTTVFTTRSKSYDVMQVYDAITRHVDWEVVKCLVIAGPGFTKDSFKTFLEAEAVRQDNR